MTNEDLCPCGSGKKYGECCSPILAGTRKATTAAELMRARYSAYATSNIDFLYASSGDEVRREFDAETSKQWSQSATWQGLEIVETIKGEATDTEGEVRFVAHYTANGQPCEHREHSFFQKIDGEWRFIDGEIEATDPIRREEPKVGRNDPCPCGSGKKYKKCCGK